MTELQQNLLSELSSIDTLVKGDYSLSFPDRIELVPVLITQVNPKCKKFLIVTDENIDKIYCETITQGFSLIQGLTIKKFVLPSGESNKTMENVMKVLEVLFEARFNRTDVVIGFGGGLITDFAGFVASIYKRGIRYVSIPTTILGMSDAAIGSKTGVNNQFGKNMIGSFYDPVLIIVCHQFLNSLDDRNFSNGLAEVIKIGAILDAHLLQELENNDLQSLRSNSIILKRLIRRSMELKIEVVSADKHESDYRMILNYGHTIGHGIEFASNEKLLHGESVSIGIVLANELASTKINVNPHHSLRVQTVLSQYNLPTKLPDYINVDEVLFYMSSDKKITDQTSFPFICISSIGEVLLKRVPFNSKEVAAILSPQISIGQTITNLLPLEIVVDLPGSKSITNRALILCALSNKKVRLNNVLFAEDSSVMINSLLKLNACSIQKINDNNNQNSIEVVGQGGEMRFQGEITIHINNSGTTARFLCGLLLHLNKDQSVIIQCSQRMKQRPMLDLIKALDTYLAFEYIEQEFHLPFKVSLKQALNGEDIHINSTISSQFVSAILLAAPVAKQNTQIILSQTEGITSEPFIEMTLQMMKQFGGRVEKKANNVFQVSAGGYNMISEVYQIEPDSATSSYDMAWAILNKRSVLIKRYTQEVLLQGDWRFTQKLQDLGYVIEEKEDGVQIRGDLGRRDGSNVRVFDFNECTDTFITFSIILATLRDNQEYSITGISNQKVKECDRLNAVKVNLSSFNIQTKVGEDGISITSSDQIQFVSPKVVIQCYDDHRIGMAFTILANHILNLSQNSSNNQLVLLDKRDCVNKTSPLFYHHILSTYGISCKPYSSVSSSLSSHSDPQLKEKKILKKAIFLIGMRCSGKSTLSKKMADLLNKKLVCMDTMIFEDYYSSRFSSLSEGITKEGWELFRERELEILKKIVNDIHNEYNNSIISCGGGIVTIPEARQILQQQENVIWLRRQLSEISNDIQNRNDAPQYLNSLQTDYEIRSPLYSQSSQHVFSYPCYQYFNRDIGVKEYWLRVEKSFKGFLKQLNNKMRPYNYCYNSEFVCLQFESIKKLSYQDYQYLQLKYHALEIRADDYFQSMLVNQQCDITKVFEEFMEVISRVRVASSKLQLIFTIRSKSEGGSFTGSNDLYWKIIHEIKKENIFDLFDIEQQKMKALKQHSKQVQEQFKSIILSIHFIEHSVQEQQLKECIEYMKQNIRETDILKLVLCQQTTVLQLEQLRSQILQFHASSIIIQLGSTGTLSRVNNQFLTPVYDSKYGTPTGIGQLQQEQLYSLRSSLNILPANKKYFIFGTDISNSPSPLIHNTQFNQLGLNNYNYQLCQIQSIEEVQPYLSSSEFAGATITMPFKQDICKYLSTIVGEANHCGINSPVVNTVIKLNNSFIGFNTDWYGIITPLQKQLQHNIHYQQSTQPYALVIGAGATTMTMVYSLNRLGFTSLILNRTVDKIQKFIGWRGVEKGFGDMEQLIEYLNLHSHIELSLIASTIPGKVQSKDYPSEIFKYKPTIFDASYIPKETPLILAAKQAGCTTIVYGIDMLLHQGYLQNQIFAGKRTSRKTVRDVINNNYNKLHGNTK